MEYNSKTGSKEKIVDSQSQEGDPLLPNMN